MGGSPRLKVPCTPGGARTEGPIHPPDSRSHRGTLLQFPDSAAGGPWRGSLASLSEISDARARDYGSPARSGVPGTERGCRGGCRRSLSVAGGREMGG